MAELTIIIDTWGHKELKEYLTTLRGIINVKINNKEELEINVTYNPTVITPKIIKYEIFLFLDIQKIPSMLAFDKHPPIPTENYKIKRNEICCEYCLKGTIADLFDIEGIEMVTCNYHPEKNNQKNITINIAYNPESLTTSQLKIIESELNL